MTSATYTKSVTFSDNNNIEAEVVRFNVTERDLRYWELLLDLGKKHDLAYLEAWDHRCEFLAVSDGDDGEGDPEFVEYILRQEASRLVVMVSQQAIKFTGYAKHAGSEWSTDMVKLADIAQDLGEASGSIGAEGSIPINADHEKAQRYFEENLAEVPPVPCDFRLGDTVTVTNAYDIEIPGVKILGFAREINPDFRPEAFIYLVWDCYWFSVSPDKLKLESRQGQGADGEASSTTTAPLQEPIAVAHWLIDSLLLSPFGPDDIESAEQALIEACDELVFRNIGTTKSISEGINNLGLQAQIGALLTSAYGELPLNAFVEDISAEIDALKALPIEFKEWKEKARSELIQRIAQDEADAMSNIGMRSIPEELVRQAAIDLGLSSKPYAELRAIAEYRGLMFVK
jgi:hypothetical protein